MKHHSNVNRNSTAFIIGSGVASNKNHASNHEESNYPLASQNNIDRKGETEILDDKNPQLDAGIFHPTPFSKRPQPKG